MGQNHLQPWLLHPHGHGLGHKPSPEAGRRHEPPGSPPVSVTYLTAANARSTSTIIPLFISTFSQALWRNLDCSLAESVTLKQGQIK